MSGQTVFLCFLSAVSITGDIMTVIVIMMWYECSRHAVVKVMDSCLNNLGSFLSEMYKSLMSFGHPVILFQCLVWPYLSTSHSSSVGQCTDSKVKSNF